MPGRRDWTKITEIEGIDTVLAAVVGVAGLPAVLSAVRKGKRVAIANKEPLVIAGQLITSEAKKYGAELLPVDSEHSAIFQALQAGKHEEVAKIVLTTSGGPFRKANPAEEYKTRVSSRCWRIRSGGWGRRLRSIRRR